ncbi:hypothetical protein QTI95_14050 [Clostridium perfringens]|nr:hypothetical protein [Clostridium perfringens]
MSKFLVYQANKNIKGTYVNKPLRKDNKIFAIYSEGMPSIKVKEHLTVYTKMGIHFYNPSDFRIGKNQKLSKKVMGCY